MLPSKTVIKQKLEFWEEGVGYVHTTAMSGVTDFPSLVCHLLRCLCPNFKPFVVAVCSVQ